MQHEFILAGFNRCTWNRHQLHPVRAKCQIAFRIPTRSTRHKNPYPFSQNSLTASVRPRAEYWTTFAGSGSTQDGAFDMGRRCDTIELDPRDERATLFDVGLVAP